LSRLNRRKQRELSRHLEQKVAKAAKRKQKTTKTADYADDADCF
jgi:hypothetical protein